MNEKEQKKFDKMDKQIKERFSTPLVQKSSVETAAVKQQNDIVTTLISIKENKAEYEKLILQNKDRI